MSEPAPVTKSESASVEGLEVLFDSDSPGVMPAGSGSFQDQTALSPGSVQESPLELIHPITVEEAAKLLAISTNAVCKRLRKGSLKGSKKPGKFKDEWLVEGNGLIKVVEFDFNPVQDGPEETPGESSSIQDQTALSPGSVQESPRELTRLVDLVEKQAAKLEIAAGQIGYLQAQLESQVKLLESKDSQIKLLTDSQHKPSWWNRFCSWFIGGGQ